MRRVLADRDARLRRRPNAIRAILITHLHGDHFGGLPFFLLDAQHVSRRTAPLVVAGPAGLRDRLAVANECLFPGSSRQQPRFALQVEEFEPGVARNVAGVTVAATVVEHASGAPALALRLRTGARTICYSGDTEWVDGLVAAARGADLFIAEAYTYERKLRYHLDYATLARHLPAIGAKRTILTHMGADMLARGDDEFAFERAFDGMAVTL